ncbi:MAG: ABC transporter substrate-binding protein, partial [Aureispira sp.]|nr:ABC transporter substrate-binding protein [Aureispira sp.]
IYSKDLYILSEISAASVQIIPEYHYDPQGFMRNFTIKDLNEQSDKLSNDSKIADFAAEFNIKYNLEPEMISGSGAYKLKEIKTSQHIILELKEDWWGNKLEAEHMKAYPEQVIYKIISDKNSAILALKSNELDVLSRMLPENFQELKDEPEIVKRFNLTSPDQFTYVYIGFNCKNPKLDLLTRKAIGHVTNRERIIDLTFGGLATEVNSPISPLKAHCHKGLTDMNFDLVKAKELLAESGWADSDGDGILDKEIEGKRVPLSLAFKYPSSSSSAKNIGLLIQEEAERVGIEFKLVAREWTVMLEETKKRDFDMFFAGWSAAPIPDDLKQIWHTSSDTYDGSNRVGFGTEATDKIIDEIRVTLDETKRNELYQTIQEEIHKEYPYIFLFAPKNCIAVSKRFENTNTYSLRPGYFPMRFKLKESVAKRANKNTAEEKKEEKTETH